MRREFLLALVLAVPSIAVALGPHEVLVLVNRDSPASVEVAERFVQLRSIPRGNVVELSLPGGPDRIPDRVTREVFTRHIWTPATQTVSERRIEGHILAWVYSAGFPTAIKTRPVVSIQGLTFIRNDSATLEKALAGLAAVERAALGAEKNPARRDIAGPIRKLYVSPLYAGPDASGYPPHFSQSLDVFRTWLGTEMPLPSMMLGHIGERGNTKETVLQCLERGVSSDSSFPKGTVFFVTRDDVRSKCREWQYPLAQQELESFDVDAVITDRFPSNRDDVIGLMTGASKVNPTAGNVYMAGAVADHLTSHAANFGHAHQTKLSEWIEAGCTASAGTVTEPVSVWAKFPSARFFTHYAAGCSILESFYQSIRCPLQILLVGEPLAQPWAPRAEVVLHGVGDVVSGTIEVRAEVRSEPLHGYRGLVFLIDGGVVGAGKSLVFDTRSLENGPHRLRAVAYRTGLIRNQAFREARLVVQN